MSPAYFFAFLTATAVSSHSIEGEDTWLSFPTAHGAVMVHNDCVHHMDDHFHVDASPEGGDVLTQGAHRQSLPPCPHAPRFVSKTAEPKSTLQDASPMYYSDWVGYAVTSHKEGYGYMSSDWKVPAAPKSTGPIPGMSSVYFFNGLEDGGGVHGAASYILQPVLSYGKSGCIINPLHFFQWHLTSFSVTGAGRAYCGKRLSVKEGEQVRGIMRLQADGNTWITESIRLSTNETSTQSTNLAGKQPDAAYVVLETMINYGCNAFPSSGSITFTDNALSDRNGKSVSPTWTQKLRHTECQQQVHIESSDSISISWGAKKSSDGMVNNSVLV